MGDVSDIRRGTPSDVDTVERVPWDEAMERMDWRKDGDEGAEHITIIAPTGSGKTELLIEILRWHEHEPAAEYVVFLSTKRTDRTGDRLLDMGYKHITSPAQIQPDVHSKYLLKPGWGKGDDVDRIKDFQRETFRTAIMRCMKQGEWTIAADEARHLAQQLDLDDELVFTILQGRSEGVSLVSGAQRPRWVPLELYDQPEHLFFFRDSDHGNVRRVAELVSVHRATVETILPHLPEYDTLYVNTRNGDMFITNTRD